MALYQGVTGKLSVKSGSGTAQYLVHMTTWSVDMTKNIDEAAYFGGSAEEEGYTEKTPGVKSWTASADGAADFGSESGQQALMDAYLQDTIVTCTFYLDEDTGLQGDGYIESLTINHAADGKGEISISVSGNGVPTLLLPTGG